MVKKKKNPLLVIGIILGVLILYQQQTFLGAVGIDSEGDYKWSLNTNQCSQYYNCDVSSCYQRFGDDCSPTSCSGLTQIECLALNDDEEGCTDTDGGSFPNVKGTLTNYGSSVDDFCDEGVTAYVNEWSCNEDGSAKIAPIFCADGRGCSDGACAVLATTCATAGLDSCSDDGATKCGSGKDIETCDDAVVPGVLCWRVSGGCLNTEYCREFVSIAYCDPIEATCTDSDGGNKKYIAGTVTRDGVDTFQDECLSSTRLKEYWCDGTALEWSEYTCDSCSDNRCYDAQPDTCATLKTPTWVCGGWSACSNNVQTKTCTDSLCPTGEKCSSSGTCITDSGEVRTQSCGDCPDGQTKCSDGTCKTTCPVSEKKTDAICLAENKDLNNGKYYANDKGTKCETECMPFFMKWDTKEKDCGINMGAIILLFAAIFGIKMLKDK